MHNCAKINNLDFSYFVDLFREGSHFSLLLLEASLKEHALENLAKEGKNLERLVSVA